MAPKRKTQVLSKKAKSEISAQIKRARLSQSELHRRSWYLQASATTGSTALPDMSWIKLSNSPATVYANGVLNACVQGTSSDTRVGNQIKESGLRLKGMISQMSTASEGACGCVRIVIVRDHDGGATEPAASDVFEISAGNSSLGSLVKWSNRKRFTFLFDQTFVLQAQASGSSSAVACTPFDIDLRAAHGMDNTLTYNANSLDVGGLQQKAVYCFIQYMNENTAVSGGSVPFISGCANFFFHDI